MDNHIILPRLLKRLIRIIHARCLARRLKPSRNQKCSFPTSNTHTCVFTPIKWQRACLEDVCTRLSANAYVVHANLNHPSPRLDLCMWRPSNASPGRLWRRCILDGMTKMQSFSFFKIPPCLRSLKERTDLRDIRCCTNKAIKRLLGAKEHDWVHVGNKRAEFTLFLEDSSRFRRYFSS